MRSGETRAEQARRPGLWTAWGQAVDVLPGVTLPQTELARASLGRPLPWVVFLSLIGAVAGDVVLVTLAPGLGAVAGRQVVALSSITPNFTTAGVGMPAVELVVSARMTAPAIGSLRVIAQCCPVVWPPELGIGTGGTEPRL